LGGHGCGPRVTVIAPVISAIPISQRHHLS
jgi:hypothetical protein